MVVGEVALETQVAVIGGGPGGYVCAIRLAQLGKKVVIVERDKNGMGGVCLNRGCIPSKALIHAATELEGLQHMADIGITAGNITFDAVKMQSWKTKLVSGLRKGVEDLCLKNGIEIIFGEARFESSKRLSISGNPECVAIDFQHAVIATGSIPIELKNLPFDGVKIITTTEALEISQTPKEIAIIGSGYNGIEMGTMFAKLGVKVKLIEKNSQILPGVSAEIATIVERRLKALGVEMYVNSVAESFSEKNGLIVLKVNQNGAIVDVSAEKVLVAIGRKPSTSSLRLENTKITLDERGFIKVNEKLQTSDGRIYAIGDVVGGAMLAHKASAEGKVAAEVISGANVVFQNKAIPSVIFSDPEVAYVGLTEKDAAQKGISVKIGKFPFRALGRAQTMEEIDGFLKVIADIDSSVLLGVEIVGPNASDLISEAVLAIEMGARLEDIALTIHPHPTLPEALIEASEIALGRGIHFFTKKA